MKITFVCPSEENLGVEYLSAVLKGCGHQTDLVFDPRLFDDSYLSIKPLSKLFEYRELVIEEIIRSKPDLVGFSLLTDNYLWFVRFARELKKKIKVPIIVGGVHPSCVPERVIEEEFVDYLIVGEGEYPLLELMESLGGTIFSRKIIKIN